MVSRNHFFEAICGARAGAARGFAVPRPNVSGDVAVIERWVRKSQWKMRALRRLGASGWPPILFINNLLNRTMPEPSP